PRRVDGARPQCRAQLPSQSCLRKVGAGNRRPDHELVPWRSPQARNGKPPHASPPAGRSFLPRDLRSLGEPANCFLPRRKRVMGTGKRPLVDMMTLAVDRLHRMSSKRVDWCGRARPVVISTVESECLLVPRPMFTALQLDMEQPILLTRV